MISFEEAHETVMKSVRLTGTERVDIADCCGRILAEDVVSDIDMPPFNKSAMDGYACRRADLANELTVIETIPAGSSPVEIVGENQCSKIMTGAMVPEGADCVIMVEYTEESGASAIRFTSKGTRDNICARAEDIHAGDIVLQRGSRLAAAHVGVLATVGCSKPLVAVRPRVGVIATGDELVEPSDNPGACQIRNSNSYQLCAQIAAMGAEPQYYGIAADETGALEDTLKLAMADCDVVLLSGGVSMGDFDLVPGVMKKNGYKLLFEKVAVKPGKPTVFGCAQDRFCFGLPGNPVSTFVLFEILVKPFLCGMMSYDFKPLVAPMTLGEDVTRKKTTRLSWLPVHITSHGTVAPVDYHGSAHLGAMCHAYGLIAMPVGTEKLGKGTVVDVRQI